MKSNLKSRPMIKELQKEDLVAPGVSLCAGCVLELAERVTLKVLGDENLILFMTPGCAIGSLAGVEGVAQAKVSVYSCLMTNIASSATGIKRYYQKMGKEVTCLCFVGDGATADIGFQALSGAAERAEKMMFICYDNEAYMNTGIQRSSTTPRKSWTTTTSVSEKNRGKRQTPKNVPLIMLAHDAAYVATASLAYLKDYVSKLQKAKKASRYGFAYIHLFTPCPTGWRAATHLGIKLSRLAVETNYFPLWEAEYGRMRLTKEIKKPKPIEEFTKWMGRFSHLTVEELREMQEGVAEKYRRILTIANSSSETNDE